ncbi:alcohol dehydrogenase catalytic domain-containing protein [Demequina activiva]|uniref:Zinc-binding alcohol dehydrogenase n=1 Tax=Demequina activiva TaxID=1582364 RepID=A0A919Q0U2_9MICO|nr:alcohol dehydrogenase catalytic domain-containing protein [Demequina activiva]GIG54225.1 zinc-binding alcohol dehydrogenase [Demequina activiva]
MPDAQHRPALAAERARVALWRGAGDVSLSDVSLPPLEPGQVLVDVSCATVCGCVRRVMAERRFGGAPTVLGHEGVGTVVATGSPVRAAGGGALVPGARVVWSPTVTCGVCPRCAAGSRATCRGAIEVGSEPVSQAWALSGAFASHLLLPAGATIATVPPWAPDGLVSPAGCAIARACAAVERVGGLAGRRVVVLGAGLIGLAVVAMAAEAGAASCSVVDPDPHRRRRALDFGADVALDRGARVPSCDAVIDASGVGDGASDALRSLAGGGALALVGTAQRATVEIDVARVAREAHTIVGVAGSEPRHLVEAVEFLVSTHAVRPWAQLVGESIPLERLAGALLADPPRERIRISAHASVAPATPLPV